MIAGIVLIMNLTNAGEAHELLEKLPLGQAGMMEFEFMPLGPIKLLACCWANLERPGRPHVAN